MTASNDNGDHGIFKMQITLGNLITCGTVLVVTTAYIVQGLGSGHSDTLINQHDLAAFQLSVNTQLTQFGTTLNKGLSDLQMQISNLPDQRAELTQLSHRADETDRRIAGDEGRIAAVELRDAQIGAQVDNITRSSNLPLSPPVRR